MVNMRGGGGGGCGHSLLNSVLNEPEGIFSKKMQFDKLKIY